jgi:Cof subfamily protein (haloacid dehalogenase superfamily)
MEVRTSPPDPLSVPGSLGDGEGERTAQPIRLIALDLDGTLIGRDLVIPERNRRALTAAMQAGCRVTIATGRSFVPTNRFACDLQLNAPLVLYQGALVQDHRDGRVIHRETLPVELAREVAEFVTTRQLVAQVHDWDGAAFTERRNPHIQRMETITGVPATPVDDLVAWLARPPLKFIIIDQPQCIEGLMDQLRDRFGERVAVVRSHELIVEITAPHVSKARGLAVLAAHLGVPREAVLAMGDHDNDAEMLAWAGLGIAMPDASPAARAAADLVAPRQTPPGADPSDRPHDEAVAWAVERYVLGGEG